MFGDYISIYDIQRAVEDGATPPIVKSTVGRGGATQAGVLVRRKLRQHGYPPDKTEKAVETVLKQAEMLAAAWAG